MVRAFAAAAVLLAALCCTAEARMPMAAMAPGPAMGPKMPKADLMFTVQADTATFTPEGQLVLAGVAQTATYSAKHGQSGIYPITYFTNSAPGSKFVAADGKWLDMPQAALYGSSQQGNNQSIVLLTLGSPTYDAAARTLSFPYQFLAPQKASLKYAGGAVGHVVMEAQENTGMSNIIGQIMPNMAMTGAALFIDTNQMALQPAAETKTWWFPWWGGYGNGCYNCGYNNGYYNNGYYNNGGGYYNNNNNNNNGWGGNNNNNNNNGRH